MLADHQPCPYPGQWCNSTTFEKKWMTTITRKTKIESEKKPTKHPFKLNCCPFLKAIMMMIRTFKILTKVGCSSVLIDHDTGLPAFLSFLGFFSNGISPSRRIWNRQMSDNNLTPVCTWALEVLHNYIIKLVEL